MKLIFSVILRVSISTLLILIAWTGLFYFVFISEVHKETDNYLKDFSSVVIQRFLSGEAISLNNSSSNNMYRIKIIRDTDLSSIKVGDVFTSEDVFVEFVGETESARVLRRIFRDRENNYYELTVATSTLHIDHFIESIIRWLFVLFTSLLIVVLMVNTFAIRRSFVPLRKFLHWLNSNNIEHSFAPIVIDSRISEIKELKGGIENFANRSKKIFEQQKEFVANASHELQTPIAICQNRLELLCESELTDQQMQDVVECMKTLQRLSKLNKSLLMLSKIENGEFESENVYFNEIVKSNCSDFEEIYAYNNINLSIQEISECVLIMNIELAKIMFVNLIKNSYTHNVEGGSIEVVIGKNFVRVTNSGDATSLDKARIFDRFYHNVKKNKSHGLGLPIIQSICRLYGFKIGYQFKKEKHIFEIIFN